MDVVQEQNTVIPARSSAMRVVVENSNSNMDVVAVALAVAVVENSNMDVVVSEYR